MTALVIGGYSTMSKATRATKALEAAGIPFAIRTYDYDPNAESIGLQAAHALGEAPDRVLKTLMAWVDTRPVCAIVPSDQEVSLKKLAAAFGGKTAKMMKPGDAERISGYKVGGISPFGQSRKIPMAFEIGAVSQPVVYINGGQRGLQVRLRAADATRMLEALVVQLTA